MNLKEQAQRRAAADRSRHKSYTRIQYQGPRPVWEGNPTRQRKLMQWPFGAAQIEKHQYYKGRILPPNAQNGFLLSPSF